MTDIGSMTTEEALAHYGVKGMKWGQRKSSGGGSSGGSSSSKKPKPTTEEIKAARKAHNARIMELHKKARDGDNSKNRTEAVRRAKEVRDLSEKIKKSPDFDKAFTATKGEKAVSWMILGPIGRLNLASTMSLQKSIAEAVVADGANFSPNDFRTKF